MVTFKKFEAHLWYLYHELCAPAFYDKNVPLPIKNKMVTVFSNGIVDESDEYNDEVKSKKKFSMINMDPEFTFDKELHFFINEKT